MRVMDFEVRRDDLATTRVNLSPPRPPADGEVLADVERFGLSANNITYGLLAERLRYWDLFPAAGGWGRLPVWGYLRIVESSAPGIEVGRRAYGLCPMSTHLRLSPARPHAGGFVDAAGHRSGLSAVYNAYSWLDADPAHRPELADQLLVLRPVFWLSFLVDDLLAEQGSYGAAQALITSASSRAAAGIAHLLAGRGVRTIGLTSAGRVPFVEGLGWYDEVLSYEQETRWARGPTVLVDVAGNRPLRDRIQRRYGPALVHTVVAGFTHRDASVADVDPAAGTTFLFVPDRMTERAARRGWRGLNADYAEALHRFATRAVLQVRPARGPTEVEAAYRAVLDNTASSADAHVLTLGDA